MSPLAKLNRWWKASPESKPAVATDPDAPCGWPPGHFYSPIPSLKDVRQRADRIFDRTRAELPGIELDPAGQLQLLRELAEHFPEFPFDKEAKPGFRFGYGNPNFGPGEALILTSWIRHFRPRRIIEIGSGYSSCAILDAVDLYLDRQTQCTFLDPVPGLLLELLSKEDQARVEIRTCQVQDMEPGWFSKLSAGDLLFIDSSHVSKVGSDVNHLIFEVLPALENGVFIHIHDVYFPFEYPQEWVCQGRAWNEAYLLRAFLQYNRAFRIRFWNNYVVTLPGVGEIASRLLDHSGSSLWLEKKGPAVTAATTA